MVLKSRVGVGTTVEVWLPVAEAREEPSEVAADVGKTVGAATRSLTVLAVDDDALVLTNTAAMLDDLGHVVVEASSGEEALTLLRRGRKVDLVISDYAMPGMTGLHLAQAIRAEWPRIPILLATGYAEVTLDSQLALPRLNKPYQQADLADAVADCLKHENGTDRVVAFRPVRGG